MQPHRTECNFCDIEHKQGKCLEQDREHFQKAIRLHGMYPDIRFVPYAYL